MVLLLAVAAAVVAFGSQTSDWEYSGNSRLLKSAFEAFTTLDADKGKTLTAKELAPLMYTAEAEDFVSKADVDRDGVFEVEEFAESPLAAPDDVHPTAGSRKRALGRGGVKPGQYIEQSEDWDQISRGALDGVEYFKKIAIANGRLDPYSVTTEEIIQYSGGLPRGWSCTSDSQCLEGQYCRSKAGYQFMADVRCDRCTFGAGSGKPGTEGWWCAGNFHLRVTEFVEPRIVESYPGGKICTNDEIEGEKKRLTKARAETSSNFRCAWCNRCAWPLENWFLR